MTIASGELFSPPLRGHPPQSTHATPELTKRLERWRKEPDLTTAAELLESAIIFDREGEAIAAARMLVRAEDEATPLLRNQAARVLSRVIGPANRGAPQDFSTAWLRQHTRENPRDALAWVELALHQVYSLRQEAALRSMKIALQVAPENRHVLRAAVRLFHHMHESDRGYQLIRKSAATPSDPWLMAAEIALATRLDKGSEFLKRGLNLLNEGRYRAREVSELAGAVGTFLSLEGNRKKGRRLFEISVADPTGNALGQAKWAEEAFDENIIAKGQLQKVHDSKEAHAVQKYIDGEFETSLAITQQWIEEERFSSRGYRLGAGAASAIEDYAASEALARKGLTYEPNSMALRNSLAFSLACQGKLTEAEDILDQIRPNDSSPAILLVRDANRGLIAMKSGDFTRADEYYRKAIAGFRSQQELRLVRAALAYYAREAVRAGHPRSAAILAEARGVQPPTMDHLIARLLKGLDERLR